jgi:membrane protease YdiL (CAAX protease family)
MPTFFKNSIFVFLLIAPLPVWLWLYITKGVTGITDLSVLLTLVLLFPIIEEILFRGFIQSFLAKRLHQRWSIISLANVLSSILFVLAHFINHPPVCALAVLIPSLVFGYIQERTNNLAAPIALHSTYNAGFFLLLG